MAKPKNKNARLAIAGPGAGKTHAMVDEIIAILQDVPPHRFLAAITYTNAAAHTIRERLHKQVRVRRNVFIGTTHAFVNRFVLAPCGLLSGKTPDDPIFAEITVSDKGTGAARYTENLLKKGIVPYEVMVPIARKILAQEILRKRISQRLAYIFVDEFQDTDIGTLELFEHFRNSGHTSMYAVGDPEQFVMGFTYRGMRRPAFAKLPFFRFLGNADIQKLDHNHRSNGEIVTFANQFRADLQQNPVKPFRKQQRVLFINERMLRPIVECFRIVSSRVEASHGPLSRLYLADENKTFDEVRDEFEIKHISNGGKKSTTVLGDALDVLALALDRTSRRICEEDKLSRLQWRTHGVALLKRATAKEFDLAQLVQFVKERFGHKVSSGRAGVLEKTLGHLKVHLSLGVDELHLEQSSSIRRAKGLQADAVLVVAKGLGELKKWLITDRSEREADRSDACRLGYVAFTRARELVCIACLKEIDQELQSRLSSLGISVVTHGQ